MANQIATQLQRDAILNGGLMALREKIIALRLFSTRFVDTPLQGTNKIVVPYHPLATADSKDFDPATGYEFDNDTDTQSREVTVNKRKYQDLSFTSTELARQPFLDPETKGMRAGEKLTEDIFADILGVVTIAAYPEATPPQTPGAFFADDVTDIRTQANKLGWSKTGRGLILDSDYTGNILKDATLHQDAYGQNSAIATGSLPRLSGFPIAETNLVPDNGENLVGMATYSSAILIAFAPIRPADNSDTLVYETLTDPDGTGLTLEYREWFDRKLDTMRVTLECNYGRDVGEAEAIIRIVGA